jgi:hypothetical protein
MAKTYIAKALARLSKMVNPEGTSLCDQVSMILSGRTSGQVKSVDDSLSFWFVGARLKMNNQDVADAETRADQVDLRRVAILLKLVLPTPGGANVADAESWDPAVLTAFVRRYAAAAAPAGTGYYLKGSYWAFSSHEERAWTLAAWGEATRMIAAGLQVVNLANAPGATQNLFVKWFGVGSSRDAVRQKLLQTQQGLTTSRVGLAYNGVNVANAGGYREKAPDTNASVVAPNAQEWGYASPQASTHNNVGLCSRFFSTGETAVGLGRMHSTTLAAGMEITRGGALVHELTHRYAHTEDKSLSDACYRRANKPVPPTRNKGYGPYTCHIVARADPALAVDNADTYRLFCEDAIQIA